MVYLLSGRKDCLAIFQTTRISRVKQSGVRSKLTENHREIKQMRKRCRKERKRERKRGLAERLDTADANVEPARKKEKGEKRAVIREQETTE